MLPQASTLSSSIDALYDFIFWTSFVSFWGIVLAMLFFVWRYHRRKKAEHTTPYIEGHGPTELTVSFILLIWVMVIFAWGWIDYKKIIGAPSDILELNLIGRQWQWEVSYPNGRKLQDELVVPQGKNVKLIMSSADVIHSFFVPEFRLKQDVVPGRYTTLWFNATQTGEYTAFCAEYCGFDHSRMLAKVRVLRPKAYDKWYRSIDSQEVKAPILEPQAARGQKVYEQKGCNACHTVTGSTAAGPTLLYSFGTERELADGKKVVMDENYIRESMMEPQAKLAKGFPPVMPPFKGLLTDDEINSLVSYLKSLSRESQEKLKAEEPTSSPKAESLEEKGEKVFNKLACNACHSISGEVGVGPTLLEIFGSQRELADGSKVVVDENYLKKSLLEPNGTTMPSYKHELSEGELKALIEYIKGL